MVGVDVVLVVGDALGVGIDDVVYVAPLIIMVCVVLVVVIAVTVDLIIACMVTVGVTVIVISRGCTARHFRICRRRSGFRRRCLLGEE